MTIKAAFTREDMDGFVAAADMWGHASYAVGFGPIADRQIDDDYDVGDRELSRLAEVIHRRDNTLLVLAELVDEGQVPIKVANVVRPALTRWADHRCTLGASTRASMVHSTAEAARVQWRDERRSQPLRDKWVTPLVNLLDAAAAVAPTVVEP